MPIAERRPGSYRKTPWSKVTEASRSATGRWGRSRSPGSPAPGLPLATPRPKGCSPPERLEVAATCTLDRVDGVFKITTVVLQVRRRVSGLDAEGLQTAAERAHEICPVSNALRGNVDIRVNASLREA